MTSKLIDLISFSNSNPFLFGISISRKTRSGLLDLIAFRNISNDIEKTLNVTHQSPQIIIIDKGIATYNASHEQILPEAIFEQLDNLNR